MEKLELKYLSPYLPYGLKGMYNEELIELSLYGYSTATICGYDIYLFLTCKVKPILRPLSDYKKFEDILDEMTDREIDMIDDNPDLVLRISYEAISKMFEHHIDVFGLINFGLAININTLK